MSRDDDDNHTIDYRQAFPVSARNRKRHAANPKRSEPDHQARFAPKAVKKNVCPQSSRSQSSRGRSIDEHPTRSMGAVAREMIAKDLNRPVDDLCEQLEAMGYEAPGETISSIRQDMFKVLRLCKLHGSIIIPAWEDD
jgi:hypothetical protein